MESEKPATGRQPIWIPVIHVAQVFLSVIILGLSAYLIHGKYFDTIGYDIFTCLLTWLVVAYLLVTAYISSLSKFAHIFITIAANALLVLFWLAAMGATAHLRSTFKYNVSIYGCYNDGSSVDSTTCLVGRGEGLEKRAAVATKLGLSIMSAIAGLSALIMLLFVVTLVHAVLTWNKSRSSVTSVAHAPQKPEEQGEGYQMAAPQSQQVQYAPVPQQQPQYAPSYSPPPQQTYSPPPQQFTPPPQGYAQQGYEQQQQQQYAQPQSQQQYMPSPPQAHSELYTPAHQQSELPSHSQK